MKKECLVIIVDKTSLEYLLIADKKVKKKIIWSLKKLDQKLLLSLTAFLQSQKIGFSRLKAVGVYSTTDISFTAIRIIVSALNSLAWAHDIPIVKLRSVDNSEIIASFDRLKKNRFNNQLQAYYYRPADITKTEKKRQYQVVT